MIMKTRDGVTFEPGMEIWVGSNQSFSTDEGTLGVEDDVLHIPDQQIQIPLSQVFSSREAALEHKLHQSQSLLHLVHATLANLVITLEGELSRDKPGPKLNIQGSHGDSLGA